MHGIDINNTVFLSVITVVNDGRLKDDPPPESICEDPIAVASGYKLDNEVLRRARRYDYYNDIKVVSMRLAGKCYHLIIPDTVSKDAPENVTICADEFSVLEEVWNRNCLLNMTVAGWKLDDFMPTLVYKGLWYKLNVDDRFKIDPTSTAYPVIPGLLRVETIYQQSVRDNRRPLPAFENMCTWWNIPLPWHAPCLTRDALSKLTPKE